MGVAAAVRTVYSGMEGMDRAPDEPAVANTALTNEAISIKTEADNDRAIEILQRLCGQDSRTPEEEAIAAQLTSQIEAFEDEHYALSDYECTEAGIPDSHAGLETS